MSVVEFQQLAEVPAAVVWFANIDNPRTRRAYQNAILAVLLNHGLRREEAAKLMTGDLQDRRGIKHLQVMRQMLMFTGDVGVGATGIGDKHRSATMRMWLLSARPGLT